ncbi:diguanylate cyclase [Noviherbaspirillum saxi]|uniref:Diguanylate cyclase n=1 Tax=Noviherbaspirillum saxi TaxID=2320863 RepID=A0A3A3FEN2_9BURK|nr:diguanylate cyclase [Noviherbaspirillum saxi]
MGSFRHRAVIATTAPLFLFCNSQVLTVIDKNDKDAICIIDFCGECNQSMASQRADIKVISENKYNILIVDDLSENLRLLTNILSAHGYTVHAAKSGASALQYLQANLADLVLLDVVMPGMDGYQVCELLKSDERTRDIPVIFLSSADHVFNKTQAFSKGGVDYMLKPFHEEELLARINVHLSLRAVQKQLVEQNIQLQKEIVERKQAQEKILYLATHDALTGLPNRALLQERIKRDLALARRYQREVAILFIDLDRFKQINDSLGHHVGDELLKAAAERMKRCVRETDSLGRLGGDEFVICLPEIISAEVASLVAKKFSKRWRNHSISRITHCISAEVSV